MFPFRKKGPPPAPEWLCRFPGLEGLDDPAWGEVLAGAQEVTIPPGATVYREGDACRNYFLVLEGSVRVQKLSEGGREIVLYRVEAGQSCVLTTTCLLSHDRYAAEGITESEVRAVMFPLAAFRRGLDRSPGFRDFVFTSYGRRIAELILLVDEVAFGRIDLRLAQLLLDRAGDGGAVEATHQQLAAELGTAREVISRQLKEFERRGWVRPGRGRVELLARDALAALGRKGE